MGQNASPRWRGNLQHARAGQLPGIADSFVGSLFELPLQRDYPREQFCSLLDLHTASSEDSAGLRVPGPHNRFNLQSSNTPVNLSACATLLRRLEVSLNARESAWPMQILSWCILAGRWVAAVNSLRTEEK